MKKKIERWFGDFGLQEAGHHIPCEFYFMPKDAAEPGLEVADFIMHASGRQARREAEGKTGFEPDFEAVFHGIDRRLLSYIYVTEVRASSEATAIA